MHRLQSKLGSHSVFVPAEYAVLEEYAEYAVLAEYAKYAVLE
jgi:hypothetical protein